MATDVLIIDDESAVRDVFAFYLKQLGQFPFPILDDRVFVLCDVNDANRAQFQNVVDTFKREFHQS